MNIGHLFGLTTLALTAALVSACSSASQPIVGESGDDVVEAPPAKGGGSKLPSKPKGPGTTSGGETTQPSGPTTNNPSNPSNPGTPGGQAEPGQPGQPGDPGGAGEPGEPGRVSVNEHCCYGGKYFRCPNSAACFGGFDINACLSTCAGPQNPCFDACFDKLDAAGPPKGCQATAEPKGVDCANGSINISN